jgi:hypothetical protein
MGQNVAQKLMAAHLVSGEMTAGQEIALRIDQTLTQDATGTLVMLELEALGLDRARTDVSVQYVDHNLLQTDSKNAEDHDFLRSACQRFGGLSGQWRRRSGEPCAGGAAVGNSLEQRDPNGGAGGDPVGALLASAGSGERGSERGLG